MKNKTFTYYYFLSIAIVLIASFYPLYMGIRVVSDMLRYGTVFAESYPKYVIPYTPISIAMIVGVLLMPLLLRNYKRYYLLAASILCLGIFFAAEFMLESMVIVTTTQYEPIAQADLEAWQIYMCAVQYSEIKTVTEVDILMGQYSPAFKLHFYLISVVLILALLNSFYGFGYMIQSGKRSRLRSLVIQSISGIMFLGLCILACFTAFFRTGTIRISPLSAVLMSAFFIVFGVTAGTFTGSFILGKENMLARGMPSFVASAVTLAMYIGELILLNGHLYRFGTGFLFDGIPGIVLAPVDVLVILLSGAITYRIMFILTKE